MSRREKCLTVAEVIEQLKQLPQDLPVSLDEGPAMRAIEDCGTVVVAAWGGTYDVEYMKRFSGRGGTRTIELPST